MNIDIPANLISPSFLDALQARRSVPSKQLGSPGPDEATQLRMLQAAARVPDHGKLVPFRFLRIHGDARHALGEALAARALELDPHDTKIPELERLLSAGSVCFALLQAAQALGFGATWLTGWPAYDPEVLRLLGVGADERVVGFIHIGTPAMDAPERDRPDPQALLRDLSL